MMAGLADKCVKNIKIIMLDPPCAQVSLLLFDHLCPPYQGGSSIPAVLSSKGEWRGVMNYNLCTT